MAPYAPGVALRIGADALFANPLRTLLSTVGVIIGVASLVAVLSLGDGMQNAARTQMEHLTDVQTVSVAPKTAEQIDGQWIPVHDYPVFTSVSGVLSRADEFHHMVLAEGRFFTNAEAERGAPVVVLSQKLANELAAGGDPRRLVGHDVRVNGLAIAVVGVLAAYDGETGYDAYVPFLTAPKVFPPTATPRPATILLRASSIETVDALKAAAEDWAARHDARQLKKIDLHTQKSRVAQAEQGILIFKLFMAALTGISLLVGGIGIMNVLLASVTERTREIGVRKALGARHRDVLMQFLTESVAISGAGSAIGVVMGLSGAFGVMAIIRAEANAPFFRAGFSWSTIIIAVVSAVAVGLVFGTYPSCSVNSHAECSHIARRR